MASKDYRASIEPALRSFLDVGESLLAASPLVPDPGTTEEVSIADELKNLLDPTLLVGLGAHPGNALQQATWGRGVIGGPESIAAKLFKAVAETTSPKVAVTDKRLMVFDVDLKSRGEGWFQRWFGEVDYIATPIHEVARANILGAISAPKGVLRQGRLLIGFTDGSGCALICGTPTLREEVVAAIGAGKPG